MRCGDDPLGDGPSGFNTYAGSSTHSPDSSEWGPIQVGGKTWSGVNFPNRRQRMKTPLLFGLLLAVLLPADAQSVGAQDSTQRPVPIEIAVIPSQSNTAIPHPSIVFDVRNVSAKCVVALSLNTEWRDSQGEVIQKGGVSTFRHTRDGRFQCLEQGETFHMPHGLRVPVDASGNPATCEVTVDFVIFDDGSTWGPGNRVEEKGRLLGKFQAFRETNAQNQSR